MSVSWKCVRCGEYLDSNDDPCQCPKDGPRPLAIVRGHRPRWQPREEITPGDRLAVGMTKLATAMFVGGLICGVAACGCVRLARLLFEVL